MPWPSDLPDLLACELPHHVLTSVLDVVPVVWDRLDPVAAVNAALIGPGGADPKNRGAIVTDLVARLTWTSAQADRVLQRVCGSTLPMLHRLVAFETVATMAPLASDGGRTLALTWALDRAHGHGFDGSLARGRLIDTLLDLPCQTEGLRIEESPFTAVSMLAEQRRLLAKGFVLNDQALADAVRTRHPSTFESPSERQKILDSLPKVDLDLPERLLHTLAHAQRWTDVAKVLKEVGPDWVHVRFPDGDTVLHKAFERDQDWAIRMIEHPMAANATPDWAIDGQGDHLIWRTLWCVGQRKTVLAPEATVLNGRKTTKEIVTPNFQKRASTSTFGPAWDQWPTLTPDRTSAVVATLRAIVRSAKPNTPPAQQQGWVGEQETLSWGLFDKVSEAPEAPINRPGLRHAIDAVIASPLGIGGLRSLLLGNARRFQHLRLMGDLPENPDPEVQSWAATLMLSHEVGSFGVSVEQMMARLDQGADWSIVAGRLKSGQASWSDQRNRETWCNALQAHWEARQLRQVSETMAEAPAVRPRL